MAAVRRRLGLTQRELAELVGAHGMTVSRWERGVAHPSGAPARLLQVLEAAAARGKPMPPELDRSDPMRLLAHLLAQAYERPDLDLTSLSATNRLPGTVIRLTRGEVMSKVVIEIAPQVHIGSVITTDSVDRLGLAPGKPAVAIVKATEVMVASGGMR